MSVVDDDLAIDDEEYHEALLGYLDTRPHEGGSRCFLDSILFLHSEEGESSGGKV